MTEDKILSRVQEYYDEKLRAHGATARGVDWNSSESQELRFAQLAKLIDGSGTFTVNDYGCGYGALADYLERAQYQFQYVGFDISTQMIATAQELHPQAKFVAYKDQLPQADYTVASGIFNVKLETDDAA